MNSRFAAKSVSQIESTPFPEVKSTITAHRCVNVDGLVAGKTLLIAGVAGSVGQYAIQFAKAAGAMVIATVSGVEKRAIAISLGADHAVDYREQGVDQHILSRIYLNHGTAFGLRLGVRDGPKSNRACNNTCKKLLERVYIIGISMSDFERHSADEHVQ